MILNTYTLSEQVQTQSNRFQVTVPQLAKINDFNQFSISNFMFTNAQYNIQDDIVLTFVIDGVAHETTIKKQYLTFDKIV